MRLRRPCRQHLNKSEQLEQQKSLEEVIPPTTSDLGDKQSSRKKRIMILT